MFGYAGRILRVNLTDSEISDETLSEETTRNYVGGRGLAAKILFEELKPGIDPFGPENKLIFATGPMTGFPFPGNARYGVYAKSPLTGIWGEGYAAGFFGPELKFAGYDAVVFEGKAETPVYLLIRKGEPELKDATRLWGKLTGETQEIIRGKVKDDRVRVAAIGPGGERLVRFACVISDLKNSGGRCGMGAVMGSKNLKAVAVRGTNRPEAADMDTLKELSKIGRDECWAGWGEGLKRDGTAGGLYGLSEKGILPTKNFQRGTFEWAEKITGGTMTETILVRPEACYACPVACKRIVSAKEPYDVDQSYGGPEYETMASFGSLLLNDNLVAISKANELCNKYSIDTISTGMSIAFAMECYESGILTKDDTDGLDLTWGNHDTIIKLVEKIGVREGIGDLLAEGTMRAAEKIGKGSERFTLHVKGMEAPMHEPRGKKGVGLSYATSNRGACHLQTYHDTSFEDEDSVAPELGFVPPLVPLSRTYLGPEKVRHTVINQNWMSFLNCACFCRFTIYPAGISVGNVVGIFSSITGWEITPAEMLTIGERAWNLCRAFNVREGISREDDRLPERFQEPLPNGGTKGESISKEDLNKALDLYYELRGWDVKSGIPTREKLEELNLQYAADESSAG